MIHYLTAEHDLLTDISLPYRIDIAIESPSQHADGSSMRQPDELPNGWYLEGGLERAEGRRMIEALATACGLTAQFDGLWECVSVVLGALTIRPLVFDPVSRLGGFGPFRERRIPFTPAGEGQL